jgi:hypothetical protein
MVKLIIQRGSKNTGLDSEISDNDVFYIINGKNRGDFHREGDSAFVLNERQYTAILFRSKSLEYIMSLMESLDLNDFAVYQDNETTYQDFKNLTLSILTSEDWKNSFILSLKKHLDIGNIKAAKMRVYLLRNIYVYQNLMSTGVLSFKLDTEVTNVLKELKYREDWTETELDNFYQLVNSIPMIDKENYMQQRLEKEKLYLEEINNFFK